MNRPVHTSVGSASGLKPLRVGILSLAHLHAEGYLPLLQRLPGVEVVGFSDDDPVRGAAAAERFGARFLGRPEALLGEGLDGVVVCSENARHVEHVTLAAEAGAHVLCEKPIATTLDDARAMREACKRAGVLFMTAFPMRFEPSVMATRELLLRGDLGALQAVSGINHSEIPKAHRSWFVDKTLAGGGAVMDHTVHLVDLLRWYTASEVVEVYAEVGNPFDPALEVDTAGLVTLTLASGVFATLDCSWSRPAGVYPRWGHLKMELIGERGVVALDAFAQHIQSYRKAAARPVSWLGWGSSPDEGMLLEFVSSLREDREPAVTWEDGYRALEVALACYESAEKVQPVKLGRVFKGF